MKRSDFSAMTERKEVISSFNKNVETLSDVFRYELQTCHDFKALRSKVCDASVHIQRAIEIFMSEETDE